MKYFIRQNYHWFFVLILLFGCKESSPDDVGNLDGAVISYFDAQKAQIDFKASKNSEKWVFLGDLIQKKYYNPHDLKAWVEPTVEKLCSSNNEVEIDLLYQTAKYLHELDFKKGSVTLANHISSLPTFSQDKKSRSLVGLIKSDQYVNESNKDSLNKYLNVLEKSLDTDSEKNLWVSYHSF